MSSQEEEEEQQQEEQEEEEEQRRAPLEPRLALRDAAKNILTGILLLDVSAWWPSHWCCIFFFAFQLARQ